MEYIKEKVNEKLNQYDESLTNTKKLLKKTLPLRREMKHTRKRNLWLQAKRKNLKDQVKEIEEQLEMIQGELKKKGLKITVINEREGIQVPTAKRESSKA